MRVGLWQIDGKLPNLALMKLSTFYKRQGWDVALNTKGDLNFASVTFSWHRNKAENLRAAIPDLTIGGTGWDSVERVRLDKHEAACRPDYDLYGIDYGLSRLTVGCFRRCPWCLSWKMEPEVRLADHITSIINPRSNFIVLLDDNLLVYPLLLEQIRRSRLAVNFNQGLDIRLVNTEVAQLLAQVDYWNFHRTKRQLHFAFDELSEERAVRRGVKYLNKQGILPSRLMFYMLVGYEKDFEGDMERFNILRGLGVDPFVMPYRDIEGRQILTRQEHHFARWVNRRLYKVTDWGHYWPWEKAQLQAEMALR